MTDRVYTEAEVMRATAASTQELFGRDTTTAAMLAGDIAMKLLAGSIGETEALAPEVIDWTAPPDYTLRAIRASSTRELVDLIANGAERLSKSIATYCNRFAIHPEEAEGRTFLRPMIFAEGSTVAEQLVGRLHINIDPDGTYSGSVARLELQGGEDAPYDEFGKLKDTSYLSRELTIRRTSVTDPVTKQDRLVHYPEVSVRYQGEMFSGQDGLLFEAKYGKPIGAYGSVVVSDLFWALDMAITYYEGVYTAGLKHPGLTYADYRDAGCLRDDLTLDWAKAEAYVRSHMDDTTLPRSGGWPVLRNWEETTLAMDPAARAEIEKYRGFLRPSVAVNYPHLLSVR